MPGRPMCGTLRPLGASNSPNASGLPGFILTVQKSIAPSRASTSLTTSKSPRDTPAEVITRSHDSSASLILAVNAGIVSWAMPKRLGTPPYWVTRALRP